MAPTWVPALPVMITGDLGELRNPTTFQILPPKFCLAVWPRASHHTSVLSSMKWAEESHPRGLVGKAAVKRCSQMDA